MTCVRAAEGHRHLPLHRRRGLDAAARAAARALRRLLESTSACCAKRSPRHGGEEVDTQGDAFFYVFSRARDAAAAAADGQRALAGTRLARGAELRVRMGLHTGEPVLSEEGRYHGMGVHRTARIMAAGHGGQILASQATASVLDDDELRRHHLRDLGEHSLKDLDRPERIYQLEVDGLADEFPPLDRRRADRRRKGRAASAASTDRPPRDRRVRRRARGGDRDPGVRLRRRLGRQLARRR